MLLDIVFSIDSVITAVGMANELWVMMAAVVASVLVMLVAAEPISEFVDKHPTIKMLALSFLLLIGLSLIAEGFGQKISEGLHLLRDGLLGVRRDGQHPGAQEGRAGAVASAVCGVAKGFTVKDVKDMKDVKD